MVFMDYQEDWMANVIGKVKESQVGLSDKVVITNLMMYLKCGNLYTFIKLGV